MSKKQSIRGNKLVSDGVKSVLKPPALSTTQCGLVDSSDYAQSVINTQLESLKKYGTEVYALSRMMVFYGLRISEVLSIKGNDIDRNGRILVIGKKGSNSRQVVDTEMVTWWLSKRLLCSELVFEFDRFYVYRCFKSVGICSTLGNGSRSKVTHLPRHLYISSLQSQTHAIEDTARIVGHKSVGSTHHYLKKSKK